MAGVALRSIEHNENASSARAPDATVDLHLIFPPQWTPYQPFLSLPSLKAHLEACGHRIEQSDWNLDFYNWFIDVSRLCGARNRLEKYATSLPDEHASYRARCLLALTILQDYKELRPLVEQLRDPTSSQLIDRLKEGHDALRSLLVAFSTAEPVMELTPNTIEFRDVLSSISTLSAFLSNRNDNPLIEFFENQVNLVGKIPRYWGLSIIGTEQIVAGLTLGRILKNRFPGVPVLIGGSVFSRLVEKEEAWVSELFGDCFDFICRYEGEQPLDWFLKAADPRAERIPNFAFKEDNKVILSPLCEPLQMDEILTPNFDGLPLNSYLSPGIVLPLLTTRGCYWGKCAFCYHGMIYQDRYRMRSPESVTQDVLSLNERYGAINFAFNDEALPPKMFRLLPDVMPPNRFFFTALYKFEKFFKEHHYQGMYNIGFRSLYIGLESASERVQKHMLKNNKKPTMEDNLRLGHEAGIWNHTFNFFGFPTETEDEAMETIDFLLDHSDILHSEGTGTFVFEHSAPIHKAPARFGVRSIKSKSDTVLDLFYEYEPESGLDAKAAEDMLGLFTKMKNDRKLYQHGNWVEREHLLLLLASYSRDPLRAAIIELEERTTVRKAADELRGFDIRTPNGRRRFIVNRHLMRVCETNEDAIRLVSELGPDASMADLVSLFPSLRAAAEKDYLVESNGLAQAGDPKDRYALV